MAGIAVSLLAIPQSLAYAQLAGVPPNYGLYAAFIPSIVAVLFVLTWNTLNHVESVSAQTDVRIRAVAQRFQWSFEYLSPDGQQARELETDGYWRFIVPEYARSKEAAGELRRLAPGI